MRLLRAFLTAVAIAVPILGATTSKATAAILKGE